MLRNDYGRHQQDDTPHPEHPNGSRPDYLAGLAAECGHEATRKWLLERAERLAAQRNSPTTEAAHLL